MLRNPVNSHWEKDTKSMTLTEKEDGRPAKLTLNE